jgi:hypothetical protein
MNMDILISNKLIITNKFMEIDLATHIKQHIFNDKYNQFLY